MKKYQILFAQKDHTWFIRLIGRMRHPAGIELNRLFKILKKRADILHILVDLTEATYIDSTNLGTLARIAQYLTQRGEGRMTLLSSHRDINLFLDSMNFEKIAFIIRHPVHITDTVTELPDISVNQQEQIKIMLAAHKALVKLDDSNEPVYRNVIDSLEDELHKH
jgi:anti-anti-sigma factor